MPATEHQPDFPERARLFADKVQQRRNELGLSQRDLIERTGLSRGYVQLLLNRRGSHRDDAGSYKPPNPTLDVIWRLAEALELSHDIAYLVDPGRPLEQRISR